MVNLDAATVEHRTRSLHFFLCLFFLRAIFFFHSEQKCCCSTHDADTLPCVSGFLSTISIPRIRFIYVLLKPVEEESPYLAHLSGWPS